MIPSFLVKPILFLGLLVDFFGWGVSFPCWSLHLLVPFDPCCSSSSKVFISCSPLSLSFFSFAQYKGTHEKLRSHHFDLVQVTGLQFSFCNCGIWRDLKDPINFGVSQSKKYVLLFQFITFVVCSLPLHVSTSYPIPCFMNHLLHQLFFNTFSWESLKEVAFVWIASWLNCFLLCIVAVLAAGWTAVLLPSTLDLLLSYSSNLIINNVCYWQYCI